MRRHQRLITLIQRRRHTDLEHGKDAINEVLLYAEQVIRCDKITLLQHDQIIRIVYRANREETLLRPIVALIDKLDVQRLAGAAFATIVIVGLIVDQKVE